MVAKSLGLAPTMLKAIPVSAALPVFDNVTGSAVAVDPTLVFAKASGFGLRPANGAAAAVPVPLTVMLKDWAGPPPLLVAERPIAVFV